MRINHIRIKSLDTLSNQYKRWDYFSLILHQVVRVSNDIKESRCAVNAWFVLNRFEFYIKIRYCFQIKVRMKGFIS